jgi:segregation and condensation protein A
MQTTAVKAPDGDNTLDSSYRVMGKSLEKMPKDLYIPPEALQVILETFEGPLDLLLYLIKKQNLNILDIPMAEITQQYINYINVMSAMKIELAAEYLVMAAMLSEIKSRLLLPRPPQLDEEDLEHDPRAELIKRLQEYERFRNAAEKISVWPQFERDTLATFVTKPIDEGYTPPLPQVNLSDIVKAMGQVQRRNKLNKKHMVKFEQLSIRERMGSILDRMTKDFTPFSQLLDPEEGAVGVVVSFIAMLELLRQHTIEFVQAQPFAEIHLRLKGKYA